MTISQAVQELYKKYVQATKMEHIHNPLAWALFKVWRMSDGKRNARKITNFDRIKGMSVDETVAAIQDQIGCGWSFVPCGVVCGGADCSVVDSGECADQIKQWLESEVTEI